MTLMRPKSMATVVDRLLVSFESSPDSDAAEVIVSSVRSGGISETAPTNVVLPTPKPPEITNLADRIGVVRSARTEVEADGVRAVTACFLVIQSSSKAERIRV